MDDLSTLHGRLRYARQTLAGIKSAAEAARRLRMEYPTYAAHENGTRGFGPEEAERYARAFKVDKEWLVWGTGNPRGASLMDKIGQLTPEYRKLAERHVDWLAAEQAKQKK